jgi:hypothetical protein
VCKRDKVLAILQIPDKIKIGLGDNLLLIKDITVHTAG